MLSDTRVESVDRACGDRIIAVMPRVIKLFKSRLRRDHLPGGLTIPQYHVLLALIEADRLPTELAREMMIAVPTLTVLADRLAARGLVERRRQTSDRRRVYLHLTSKGQQACQELRRMGGACAAELVAPLTTEEKQQVLRALDALERAVHLQRAVAS